MTKKIFLMMSLVIGLFAVSSSVKAQEKPNINANCNGNITYTNTLNGDKSTTTKVYNESNNQNVTVESNQGSTRITEQHGGYGSMEKGYGTVTSSPGQRADINCYPKNKN